MTKKELEHKLKYVTIFCKKLERLAEETRGNQRYSKQNW